MHCSQGLAQGAELTLCAWAFLPLAAFLNPGLPRTSKRTLQELDEGKTLITFAPGTGTGDDSVTAEFLTAEGRPRFRELLPDPAVSIEALPRASAPSTSSGSIATKAAASTGTQPIQNDCRHSVSRAKTVKTLAHSSNQTSKTGIR